MKKLTIIKPLILIILLLVCCFFTSCKKKELTIENPIALVYKDSIPYIINDKQETLSLEAYDSIVPYFDDYLIVKKNGLFGYITNTGKVLIEPQFDEAYPFSMNMAVVKKQNKTYIINYSNEILYEFSDGITSIGYFSDNLLVIGNDKEQGYLKYDEETNSFSYLFDQDESSQGLNYEYCGQFHNGYAVIGFRNSNGEFRYSHIDSNGNRLYNLDWEYANDFYDGYAVVGETGSYVAEEFNTIDGKLTGRTKTINCTIYHYISTTGEYLTTTSINKSSGNPTTSVATFVQANSFKNNVAVVAKMYYLRNSTNYFNNYHIVSTNGNEVCRIASGLINNFGSGTSRFYEDIFIFGDYYILSYKALEYRNYYISVNNEAIDTYRNILVNISENDPWIETFQNDFMTDKYEKTYIVDHMKSFYGQSLFKQTKYINDYYIAKVQSSVGYKDTCGLVMLTLKNNVPSISFYLPPFYDDIIF